MNKKDIFERVKGLGTVLSFPDRGPWGSSKYRGNFSGWIPAALICKYDAESVAEIFAGGGTTSDLCKDMEIPYCGIDLNPNPVRDDIISMDILDYEQELPDGFYQADLQILHPPYPCIKHIHYSNGMWKDTNQNGSRDIQEMSWEEGMKTINKAVMRGYAAMPKGSYQAVVVGDIRRNGEFHSMLHDLAIPGKLEQLLVKMQHNTTSGRTRQKPNGIFLIEHEFITVIKKPSGYEIAYTVPKRYRMDIRDSKTATWKDVVYAIINQGQEMSLAEIYREIQGHKKTESNPNWKAKVRQTLQMLRNDHVVYSVCRGTWKIA